MRPAAGPGPVNRSAAVVPVPSFEDLDNARPSLVHPPDKNRNT